MKKSPYILIDAVMECRKMGLSGMFLSSIEGQTKEINDMCRVKDAQKSVEAFLSQFRGRYVSKQDEENIKSVVESNRKARKKLFGSEEFVWYLTEV